jgi:hypothetical protein
MAIKTHLVVGGGDAISNTRQGRAFALKYTIDASAVAITSGDIVKLLTIPANTLIERIVANVVTAEGGTLTVDLGDYLTANDNAVDADGYLDGFNGNSAVANSSSTETLTLSEGTPNTAAFGPAYARGKFYRAATSYLGALFNNDADVAVIDVLIFGVDMN